MVNKANLKLYFLKQYNEAFLRSDNIFCKDISCLAMLKDTLELIYYGLWGYAETIKLWSLLSSNSCIDNKMSCCLLDISLRYHNIFDTAFIQARHRESYWELFSNNYVLMIIWFHCLLVTHCFSYYSSLLIKILTVNNLVLLHTLIIINQSFYTIKKKCN